MSNDENIIDYDDENIIDYDDFKKSPEKIFLDKLSLEERLNERILECEESEERTLQRVKDLINKEKCITFDKELEEKITRQVVSETHRYETDIIKSVFQKLKESVK